MKLISGREHYEQVISAVSDANVSVWISSANVKEMLVEGTRKKYASVLRTLDALAKRGVELRLLHAEIPSGPFRAELARNPRLLKDGGLQLRRCPRVHMKVVVVDGEFLYLGSANWTGAGLGAKGDHKRNFELGVVTSDSTMLDQVQGIYEQIWSGGECKKCRVRKLCPGPLDSLEG